MEIDSIVVVYLLPFVSPVFCSSLFRRGLSPRFRGKIVRSGGVFLAETTHDEGAGSPSFQLALLFRVSFFFSLSFSLRPSRRLWIAWKLLAAYGEPERELSEENCAWIERWGRCTCLSHFVSLAFKRISQWEIKFRVEIASDFCVYRRRNWI